MSEGLYSILLTVKVRSISQSSMRSSSFKPDRSGRYMERSPTPAPSSSWHSTRKAGSSGRYIRITPATNAMPCKNGQEWIHDTPNKPFVVSDHGMTAAAASLWQLTGALVKRES